MKKTITFLSRRAAVMLLATLLLTLTAQTARAAEYKISTLEELRQFMEAVQVEDFAGDVIRLTADIDCKGGRFNTGDPEYPSTFRGTFDGQGHTIYNFVHTPTGDGDSGYGTAMFDFAETGATIKDLTLEGTLPGTYSGAYSAAFVLAVESPLGLLLDNCHFNGSVTNVYHSAALVGFASPGADYEGMPSIILNNCSANANITTTSNNIAGGLVAKGTGVEAYDCSFKGKVTSLGTVGGLIGVAINCKLENCFEGGYTYIDENSNNVYSTNYTVLDNTMTTISAGWYVVNSDVTFNGDLSTNAGGEVNIILCDGATLTANNITPIGHSDFLRIYGQSQGTGTANISGRIEATSSLQIYGGTINVTGNIMCPQSGVGIYGGNVTAAGIDGFRGLNFTGGTITAGTLQVSEEGSITLGGATVKANSYNVKNGNVTILTGITYYDGTGASYTAGNLTSSQVSGIAGKTLRTHDYRGGDIGNENNVTWAVIDTDNNGTYETLTISGTGAISSNPWYSYKNDITTVVINNGVTGISSSVFMNTTNLKSVSIPASVTFIRQQVFDGCTNLETVSGCEGVTSIGNNAFRGTKWLTDQPDGVIYIGKVAYLGKNVSGEVNIKASTVSISNNAFKDCTNLTSITIPNSVTDIGSYTFENCTGLTSVTIPSSVESIPQDAFRKCTSLTSITIPNSVTYIRANAFFGCTSLISIEIPNSVTDIGYSAFEGCTNLTSITIPNSVTDICYSAFEGCTGLTSVTIPSSVESIGEAAFKKCTSLTSITIPNSVTYIDENAFSGCSNLATVTIGRGMESIGVRAFESCSKLETVTVYAPNCSLGNYAFISCSKLANIYVFSGLVDDYQSLPGWSNYSSKIKGMTGGYCGATDHETDVIWLLSGTSPDYTLTISGTGAMEDYDTPDGQPWKEYRSTITSVVIEDGVTSIGNNAFAYCTGASFNADDLIAQGVTYGENSFNQVGCLVGTLANNADNTEKIALLYQAARANVTLSDRTLYKDGNWNTLCLPFNVTDGDETDEFTFSGTPLEGATVMELDGTTSGFDASTGTLTLNFNTANSITAGTPYIVKWASGDDLENPLFRDVTINATNSPVTSQDGKVQLRGIYAPAMIYSADHDNLFLGIGKNNQNEDVSMLYWPNTTDYSLGAFRAYFHVDLTETNGVRDIVLNFEDGTQTTGIIGHTEITEITEKADAWYTLDGRKLDAKPNSKGIYIHGGRKTVIK